MRRTRTQLETRRLKRGRPAGESISLKDWARRLAGKGLKDAQQVEARAWLQRKGLQR